MMRELLTRLRFLVSRRTRGETDEELRFHVEQAKEVRVAAGMTPGEAHRQALIEFGGVERAREQTFEQRPGWWLGTVEQDVRYALRGFRRNPVFTIAAVSYTHLDVYKRQPPRPPSPLRPPRLRPPPRPRPKRSPVSSTA